jgi:hypothetical protein
VIVGSSTISFPDPTDSDFKITSRHVRLCRVNIAVKHWRLSVVDNSPGAIVVGSFYVARTGVPFLAVGYRLAPEVTGTTLPVG